LNNLKTS